MADTIPSPSSQQQNLNPGNRPAQGENQAQTNGVASQQQPVVQQPQAPQNQTAQLPSSAQQVVSDAKNVLTQAVELITAQPSRPQPPVTQDEKVWATISYIPMVALVSLLMKPKSEYVKLHARQGLLLFVLFILAFILDIILYPVGFILGSMLHFGLMVLGVFSMYQALIGNWWKTPVLGQLSELIPTDIFTITATQAITGQPPTQNPEVNNQQNQPPTANPSN